MKFTGWLVLISAVAAGCGSSPPKTDGPSLSVVPSSTITPNVPGSSSMPTVLGSSAKPTVTVGVAPSTSLPAGTVPELGGLDQRVVEYGGPSGAVPAYFGPIPLWQVMIAAATSSPMPLAMAVLNPANGPGLSADPGYASVIALAKEKGVRVLGYVATGHGRGTGVLDAIEAYKRLYGVVDIFFDEAASDCPTLDTKYRPWIAAVRANSGFVAVNPGVTPASCWAAASDLIVNFEGNYGSYLAQTYPDWIGSYPPSLFWHIVYSVPVGSEQSVIDRGTQLKVGHLYTTADGLPNPYDTLSDEFSVLPAGAERTDSHGTPGPTGAPIILVPPTAYTGQ